MKVFSNQGRRYDLEEGMSCFTVYAMKDGTIINHTLGSTSHEKEIRQAIRTHHNS